MPDNNPEEKKEATVTIDVNPAKVTMVKVPGGAGLFGVVIPLNVAGRLISLGAAAEFKRQLDLYFQSVDALKAKSNPSFKEKILGAKS